MNTTNPSPELVAQCLTALMQSPNVRDYVETQSRLPGQGGPVVLWVGLAREYAAEIVRQFDCGVNRSFSATYPIANLLAPDELYSALGAAIEKIEAAGASVALTEASTLVCDIRSAIGNQWNPANVYSAERVREVAAKQDEAVRQWIKERDASYSAQKEAHP